MDLYKLPKDILVKLISTIQEDVKKKKIFTILMANGAGGFIENYIICADNIDTVYLHFYNMFREENKTEKSSVNNNANLEINQYWNVAENKEKYFLTEDDLKFDIGLLTTKHKNYTQDTVEVLINWYCRKFKIQLSEITVDHIKDIFEIILLNLWMVYG